MNKDNDIKGGVVSAPPVQDQKNEGQLSYKISQKTDTKKDVIDRIFYMRRNFVLIGLTGRTGSGCSTVAEILKTQDIHELKSNHKTFRSGTIDNQSRKDKIIYEFLSEKWQPFVVIRASDVIYYYALQLSFVEFKAELSQSATIASPLLLDKARSSNQHGDGTDHVKTLIENAIDPFKEDYNRLHENVLKIEEFIKNESPNIDDIETHEKMLSDVLLEEISEFRKRLEKDLSNVLKKNIAVTLQRWGNNIRKYDSVLTAGNHNHRAPSCLAHKINEFLKIFRRRDKREDRASLYVIDALRNPFEILYFRERYAAFFTMSVNTDPKIRHDQLFRKGLSKDEIAEIDDKEKEKSELHDRYSQIDIDKCIELSDIHLSHDGTPSSKNRALKNQIFTYIALIYHPGLVPPSPIERVMQIAYTAKLNSGCLSRQVGAAVTNSSFSVLSVGWNTVAEGQTPCSLRSLSLLYNQEDDNAFSNYERNDDKFQRYIEGLALDYGIKKGDSKSVDGVNISYCFKDVYTSLNEKHRGNQVHTRSLHAEENAFLQLAKYGSQGIKDGKLFTTASCCELCGKKAYQLGIREIYYIDAYPGITMSHILNCGDNKPVVKLFSGVIGRAYIDLYDQLVPLKDEIKSMTGVNVKGRSVKSEKTSKSDYGNK